MFAAGLRPTDTVYNPLPLYHSSAGILSCGPSFYIGLSVALRKKFSAKDYWKDCVKYNATVDIYLINTKMTFIIISILPLDYTIATYFYLPSQVCQYIGEICRYLLNTPECPEEKTHNVRLIFGNGKYNDVPHIYNDVYYFSI